MGLQRTCSTNVGDLAASGLEVSHPLLEGRSEVKNVATLVLTANRGLCGGYNGGILRQAGARLRELRREEKDITLEVSGKRGLSYFKYEGLPVDRADALLVRDRLCLMHFFDESPCLQPALQSLAQAGVPMLRLVFFYPGQEPLTGDLEFDQHAQTFGLRIY